VYCHTSKKICPICFQSNACIIDELRTGKKTAYRGQYSFDMNGNEVSCIYDFYDIENLAAIEDARFYNEPTFYKVEVGVLPHQ